MSDPAELAKKLQKISLSHGVVLSYPLLKQMALKALEEQKSKPLPGGTSISIPTDGSTVKVAFHKNEKTVTDEQVKKSGIRVKGLAALYTQAHEPEDYSFDAVVNEMSEPKPKYAQGGYISGKYDYELNHFWKDPYAPKYAVQGTYQHVKVSKKISPNVWESIANNNDPYVEVVKNDLWIELCKKAQAMKLNLIGYPAYATYKAADPWSVSFVCSSHAIGIPPDLPPADKPAI